MNDDQLVADLHRHLDLLRERLVSRGFAGRVGFGSRPAVIVVDFVRAFTDPSSPLGGDYDAELGAARTLLDAARARGVPIVFSTAGYEPDLSDSGVWARKVPNQDLVAGSPGTEVDDRLGRTPEDMLLVKKYASCFFGTDLASRLVSRGVDTLLVAGCSTSGCVRATVVDGCSLGFHVAVVREAVGDRSSVPDLVNLFDMDVKYADVVALEEATGYVATLGQASTETRHHGRRIGESPITARGISWQE